MIGVVVGLAAEARIARRLPGHVEVAIGGGNADGARRAAERLLGRGASALVSFGLAAGLSPDLPAGSIVVPRRVLVGGASFTTDRTLATALGGSTPHDLLHSERIVGGVEDKRRLFEETRCAALDMESGAVARAALAEAKPFAVLRAICDPAGRSLPPLAFIALAEDGRVGVRRIAKSLSNRPSQIGSLLGLARDAWAARRALSLRVRKVASLG